MKLLDYYCLVEFFLWGQKSLEILLCSGYRCCPERCRNHGCVHPGPGPQYPWRQLKRLWRTADVAHQSPCFVFPEQFPVLRSPSFSLCGGEEEEKNLRFCLGQFDVLWFQGALCTRTIPRWRSSSPEVEKSSVQRVMTFMHWFAWTKHFGLLQIYFEKRCGLSSFWFISACRKVLWWNQYCLSVSQGCSLNLSIWI